MWDNSIHTGARSYQDPSSTLFFHRIGWAYSSARNTVISKPTMTGDEIHLYGVYVHDHYGDDLTYAYCYRGPGTRTEDLVSWDWCNGPWTWKEASWYDYDHDGIDDYVVDAHWSCDNCGYGPKTQGEHKINKVYEWRTHYAMNCSGYLTSGTYLSDTSWMHLY